MLFHHALLDISLHEGGTRATTRGVGTHAYAAPEQLANEEPDAKVTELKLNVY